MATGMARGAKARGKRIAFGDGKQIIWDHNSPAIFQGNPNIAPPGSEGDDDIEWIGFHRGNRIYNTHDKAFKRWTWNYSFRPTPGEMFFDQQETAWAARLGSGFVALEAFVPGWKSSSPNKQWPLENYQRVVTRIARHGYKILQFCYPGTSQLGGTGTIKAPTFRHALAALSRAALYIGPEGGLHHGAAAVGIPAVVLFGGFIPPQVTGYDTHTNLTGGAEACGSLEPCGHCKLAMEAIQPKHVYVPALEYLEGKRDPR